MTTRTSAFVISNWVGQLSLILYTSNTSVYAQQTAHVFSPVFHQLKLVENWWKTGAVLITS